MSFVPLDIGCCKLIVGSSRDDTLTKLLSKRTWTRQRSQPADVEFFQDLSNATLQRNAELESRVAELEVELHVWKQAHSVALEASEREAKAHNVQLAALNRQISNMDSFKSVSRPNPLRQCSSH